MEDFFIRKDSYYKIIAILIIAVGLLLGTTYTAKNIVISIDGNEMKISTHIKTVEKLLEKKNIALDKDAYVSIPLDARLENNMVVNIKTPKTYTLASGGLSTEIKSVYIRVKDILKDLNVELGENDYTNPALENEVPPGTEIEIVKVEETFEELEESIPYESIIRKTDRLDVGVENVIQEGQDGLKNIKIKKIFENGKLVSENNVEEYIINEPMPMIVEKGTKNIIASSRGNVRYRKAITMVATAYDLSYRSTGKYPGDKYYGITASGTKAKPGVVAVDPRIIPLGTKLYVESLDNAEDYGFCTAEDTGGAIRGNRIDLFFNTSNEVFSFGKRKVKVYVLE